MELCLFTDSVPSLSFDEALDLAVRIGAPAIEIATGGQSSAPHLDRASLLVDAAARRRFLDAFDRRGLRIAALNCSAWPLHPVTGEGQRAIIRDTIRLAELLGVRKIVTMSGVPGDGAGATTIDWTWYPGSPPDAQALLARQWDEAIAAWTELGRFALEHGVSRVCFELHPMNLVYNVPTFQRLRAAVGDPLAVNLDPSHFFWQSIDPLAAIRVLDGVVGHAHLKDTEIDADEVALAGVLDDRPFGSGPRAWQFRYAGAIRDARWWGSFIDALRDAGYDDVVSIENEDATLGEVAGVEAAADFIRPVLASGRATSAANATIGRDAASTR